MTGGAGKSWRVRGHHLLCLISFPGQGYGGEFEDRFREMGNWYVEGPLDRMVTVVEGPDDACLTCRDLGPEGCISVSDGPEPKIRALDAQVFRALGAGPGSWKAEDLLVRVVGLSPEALEGICRNCSWFPEAGCEARIRTRLARFQP